MLIGAAGEAIGLGASAAPSGPRNLQGDQQPAASSAFSVSQAERLAEGLCRMRGAGLKLGQMLSLADESILPPAVAAALERVRTQADVMPPRQLESVMTAELGKTWRALLGGDGFEIAPVAAASIGQVHRAKLPDGRVAAVKIQYPGVADSIHSDLGNLRRLLLFGDFLPKGLYLDNIIAVAREELSAECDYEREATSQERFRVLLAGDAAITVPAVVRELSTRRVLVTEWLEGMPIDQVVAAGLPQEVRDHIARTLLRLTLKELFVWRFMQTDPNWGEGPSAALHCVTTFFPQSLCVTVTAPQETSSTTLRAEGSGSSILALHASMLSPLLMTTCASSGLLPTMIALRSKRYQYALAF
jgi:aarF domain-containing kinase